MAARWMTIAECAAAAGVRHVTMRRRLLVLARECPGLLRSLSSNGGACRKWLVNPRLLERVMSDDEHDVDEVILSRIEQLEATVGALRNAYRALRRRVDVAPKASTQARRALEPAA